MSKQDFLVYKVFILSSGNIFNDFTSPLVQTELSDSTCVESTDPAQQTVTRMTDCTALDLGHPVCEW